jgi:hypothetical protein
MRSLLEQHDERVLIGEIYLPIEQLVAYYGKDLRGAHLPFNFQLNGIRRKMPVLQMGSPGSRSAHLISRITLQLCATIQRRCSISIAICYRFAGGT